MDNSSREQLTKLKAQIDWAFIEEMKKDPQEFHCFCQEGEKMMRLVSVLQEIDSKP